MGALCATPVVRGDPTDIALNKTVDSKLKLLQNDELQTIKILLLGAGECGKSTIMKQMKILHQGGFDEAERKEKKTLVRTNTLDAMCSIIAAAKKFSIDFEDSKTVEYSDEIVQFQAKMRADPSNEEIKDIGDKLIHVFQNESIQKVFLERSSEFVLLDSAAYFFENIKRTFACDYLPDQQDIVRTRLATVGIIESSFVVDKKMFKFFDVGGQRGERKKWIHCFDGVRAILFVASLSEYDQVLEEDSTRNRMEESLALFEGIVNLPWFHDTPIILFLNKEDIFVEKIMKVDMGAYFNDYTGGKDPDLGAIFIKEKYFQQNFNESNAIYVHRTNATDTTQFDAVWTFTKHIVLQHNLNRAGLVL